MWEDDSCELDLSRCAPSGSHVVLCTEGNTTCVWMDTGMLDHVLMTGGFTVSLILIIICLVVKTDKYLSDF